MPLAFTQEDCLVILVEFEYELWTQYINKERSQISIQFVGSENVKFRTSSKGCYCTWVVNTAARSHDWISPHTDGQWQMTTACLCRLEPPLWSQRSLCDLSKSQSHSHNDHSVVELMKHGPSISCQFMFEFGAENSNCGYRKMWIQIQIYSSICRE